MRRLVWPTRFAPWLALPGRPAAWSGALTFPGRPRLWPPLAERVLPPGTLGGEAALEALWALGEEQARSLLAGCAAALCLYPAWERRDWGMPSAQGTLSAYGGGFCSWPERSSLGQTRQQHGRPNVLHLSSGLVFALYRQPEQLVLVLGGTNTSHSESQFFTLPSEARQFGADVLNLLGRLPRLFAVAAELTALVESERGRSLPEVPLTLAGHSLGGGLVQYAAGLHGLEGLAFSPTALGRAVAAPLLDRPEGVGAGVLALSLDGDPIPLIGTQHLQARVLGRHLRLPLHPGVPPARHATSHGQVYLHLLAWLRERWPELPSALA
ncbi:hypothetical protein DKM44_03560 [Deinococcus irradiatisoli]|uniref:Fungal lipase-like domain-containing protein n=1 Tax=Deinococcus irradiatisoli TaxID=2202254 RepID=A0A2Z3JMH2_9DEIO|nr:hypothetical protein [Deinococcus irradiatisoli]AWN22424.1 hypothetical protein DKM44_03560 [Deinococcus irradiatisoli]